MNKTQPTEKLKERFQFELKEKFNETKFDEDIKSGKEISLDNLDEYRKREKEIEIPKNKDDDKNQISNGQGLFFKGSFKNGEYVAVGSNGHVIKSKDIDDFHRQLAKVFKLNALKNNKEAICSLHIGEKTKNKKQVAESFARNFINEGIVVKGDLPKSPEFWDKMKAEYLAKKGNSLENWNRLTRFVPKEYMRANNGIQISQQQGKKKKPAMAVQMAKARGGR